MPTAQTAGLDVEKLAAETIAPDQWVLRVAAEQAMSVNAGIDTAYDRAAAGIMRSAIDSLVASGAVQQMGDRIRLLPEQERAILRSSQELARENRDRRTLSLVIDENGEEKWLDFHAPETRAEVERIKEANRAKARAALGI